MTLPNQKQVIPLWKDDPGEESIGRTLGYGKNKTYDLARRGKIPGVERLDRGWIGKRRPFERWLDGESDL